MDFNFKEVLTTRGFATTNVCHCVNYNTLQNLTPGLRYEYHKQCDTCCGKGYIPEIKIRSNGVKYTKKHDCPNCKTGYIQHLKPIVIGQCNKCNGTTRYDVTIFDSPSDDARRQLSTLIDFTDNEFVTTSERNCVGGVTDYMNWRKIDLSDPDVRRSILTDFLSRPDQWLHFLIGNDFCDVIKIAKGRCGYALFAVKQNN